MTRMVAIALTVALLGDASTAVAGPIGESGKRAAQQAAQAPSKRWPTKALVWTGLALFVSGVALVQVYGGADRSCATRACPDPQGELPKVFLGLGLAGIGASMVVVGALRDTGIQIRPGSIAYRVRF